MRPVKKSRTPEHVSGGESPARHFKWPAIQEDIQIEIYGYLTPTDLLNLSRIDKDTHDYFKGHNAELFWRVVRRNVPGLPDCPGWLAEMRYASLCFEDHCQSCLAVDDSSKNPLWQFYTRYCTQCEPIYTTTAHPYKGLEGGSYQNRFGGDVARILPTIRCEFVTDDGDSTLVTLYHLPDVTKLRDALHDASDSERFITIGDWYVSTMERRSHAERCHVWKANMDETERERLEKIRLERYRKIHDKLVALGYITELINLGIGLEGLSVSIYAFFKKPHPLNDDEWDVSLPAVKRFLDSRRLLESRLTQVRAMFARLRQIDTVLDSRRNETASGTVSVWPCALDLVDLPVVAHLIQFHEAVFIPAAVYEEMIGVDAFGLEPPALDPQDSRLDGRVACGACSQLNRVMVVMGWRCAVQHMIEAHGMSRVEWYPVCSEVASYVKKLERSERAAGLHGTRALARWTCVRCDWPQSRWAYDFVQLQKHFVERSVTSTMTVPIIDGKSLQSPPGGPPYQVVQSLV
ncbi:hypothetical protein C8Q76DRAFT_799704 [Earliella scabrosa]|nr:hypothetical protein C8Q76DRAFT_799704 [Earliella scabrosa]